MQCPFDASELTQIRRQEVEIEWCPSCKGVWLERGELDKIIERSLKEEGSQRADDRYDRERERERDRDRYEREKYERDRYEYDKKYKRKSWLSEIFD